MGEAGIRDWFGQQLLDMREAIGGQGRLCGAMTAFYLLGPFFMLIELSPSLVSSVSGTTPPCGAPCLCPYCSLSDVESAI